MTAQSGRGENRQVIPRWRAFGDTVRVGELRSLVPRWSSMTEIELRRARERTREQGDSVYARGELLSMLTARGAWEAARSLARTFTDRQVLPPTLVSLADSLVNDDEAAPGTTDLDVQFDPSQFANALGSSARQRLQSRNNNPVAWVDLALAHTIQGLAHRAEQEIRFALQLAPDNRFVLRSAACLLVHLERPDEANDVLHASPRLKHDPWLMAAELSTAQLAYGRTRNALRGREMIAHSEFGPRALSELISELATTELQSGHDRRARALFRQSFEDPTENAVAQAASWSERSNVQLEPELLAIDGVFEARALESARTGDWAQATREAASWHRDQPFSLEPFRFASYTSSLGAGEFARAAEIAQAGLRLHPNDPMLRNNAAYALASMGRPAEARRLAETPANFTTPEDFVALATAGLISFRELDTDDGVAKYQMAVRGLNRLRRRDLAAMATAHWALEEKRLELPTATRVLQLALKMLPDLPTAERQALGGRLAEPTVF